ncbi:uncharacterized protein TNCV_2299381 [Trichonephila clavipes]|nr:uncharacterized protein TNCV_2299381 [Trichonephila clavipes]
MPSLEFAAPGRDSVCPALEPPLITLIQIPVPSRHGGTVNSRRDTSLLVRFVEGEERWITQRVLPLNWGGTEPNRTVTCMVQKTTANDRRHLALCHDEFRGL